MRLAERELQRACAGSDHDTATTGLLAAHLRTLRYYVGPDFDVAKAKNNWESYVEVTLLLSGYRESKIFIAIVVEVVILYYA